MSAPPNPVYAVMVRRMFEQQFSYIAKDRKSYTPHVEEAATFPTEYEAIMAAEKIVKIDGAIEAKAVKL